MRIANSIVAAAAFLAVSGAARAESLIPSNYVDDFGSRAPSTQTVASPAEPSNAHASFIPSNYVDDFGDDFGVAPGAPREETATARAQHAPSSDSSGS